MFTNVLAAVRGDRRVRRRFERVESHLRNRDISALPQKFQLARAAMLDSTRTYYRRGIFPRNYTHLRHRPAFIDKHGRVCAVAHLMIQSGQEALARRIAVETNDAYVRDLNVSEFDDWVAQSGLTKEELAFIQPSYHCTFHPDQFPYLLYHINGILYGLLSILYMAASISIVSWLLNGLAFVRRRRDRLAIGLGIVAGTVLIVVGLIQYQTIQSHNVAMQNSLYIPTGLAPRTNDVWRPCIEGLTQNSQLLHYLQSVLPQNPEAFRNLLLVLGAATLLVSFASLSIQRKVLKE